MTDVCCSGHDGGDGDLDCGEEHDATLSMCCMREKQQQARSAALRAALLRHDPTSVRGDAIRSVIKPPPAAAAPRVAAERREVAMLHDDNEERDSDSAPAASRTESSFSESSLDSNDDDWDAETQRIRELRLQEMRAQAARALALRESGAGGVRVVTEVEAVRGAEEAQCAVLWLRTGEEECGGAQPQEPSGVLSGLAGQYLGTAFLASECAPGRRPLPHLRCPDPPCLLALRSGVLVGSLPLSQVGWGNPGGVRGEEVEGWLRRAGVLSRGGVGDDSGDESDDDDNDNERESFGPHCDKCGRPGYHVHIGVPERAGSGGGGGSESEGEG